MSLITPVAGAYIGTYQPSQTNLGTGTDGLGNSLNFSAHGAGLGAAAVGICGDNGYELQNRNYRQRIDLTDQFGQTFLDGIYRGQDWTVRLVAREYGFTPLQMAMPWSNPTQAAFGDAVLRDFQPALGPVARRLTDMAGTLVLNSIDGTPAFENPTSITASLAIQDESPTGFFLTSKLREVPVSMSLLPYLLTQSGVDSIVWFVTT